MYTIGKGITTMTIGSDTFANSIHHQKRLYYLNVLLRHTMTIGSDTFANSIHHQKLLYYVNVLLRSKVSLPIAIVCLNKTFK
jgi:hypothetical protein